jgi:hypothetical protein
MVLRTSAAKVSSPRTNSAGSSAATNGSSRMTTWARNPLGCWRRLHVRWDRDSGRFFAFVLVACALVCFNQL